MAGRFSASVVKWRMDCRMAICTVSGGSNSVVECQLPKLDVAGSNPVSRSIESISYKHSPN